METLELRHESRFLAMSSLIRPFFKNRAAEAALKIKSVKKDQHGM